MAAVHRKRPGRRARSKKLAFEEAVPLKTGTSLRSLFVVALLHGSLLDPTAFWEQLRMAFALICRMCFQRGIRRFIQGPTAETRYIGSAETKVGMSIDSALRRHTSSTTSGTTEINIANELVFFLRPSAKSLFYD